MGKTLSLFKRSSYALGFPCGSSTVQRSEKLNDNTSCSWLLSTVVLVTVGFYPLVWSSRYVISYRFTSLQKLRTPLNTIKIKIINFNLQFIKYDLYVVRILFCFPSDTDKKHFTKKNLEI